MMALARVTCGVALCYNTMSWLWSHDEIYMKLREHSICEAASCHDGARTYYVSYSRSL